MKLAIVEPSNENKPIINLISKRPGLYTGSFPDISNHLTIPRNSDAYLAPHNLKTIETIPHYMDKLYALSHEKPVLIVNSGDFPRRRVPGNFIFLQYSIETGYLGSPDRTIILPYNIKPFKTKFRIRRDNPVVSFVGQVPPLTPGRVARSLVPLPPAPTNLVIPHFLKRNSALIRNLGVRKIRLNDGIALSKHRHSGSLAHVRDPRFNRKLYEFISNASDFIFCPRGDANNSFRFYETIAAGRIPIVPDSNIFLPNAIVTDTSDLVLKVKPSCLDMYQKIDEKWIGLSQKEYRYLQGDLKAWYSRELQFDKYVLRILNMDIEELINTSPTPL